MTDQQSLMVSWGTAQEPWISSNDASAPKNVPEVVIW